MSDHRLLVAISNRRHPMANWRHKIVSIRDAFSAVIIGVTAVCSIQYTEAQELLEEVLVTGSLIKGSPTDAANPVSVYRRDDLALQNNPSLSDFSKSLSVSSGVDGESNPFQSRRTEGLANINLRGLGPARTLVLINGQRQVAVPVRLSAGRFVDLNSLPASAIERVEILKEGAAATYGSDAVGGVANFITRADFEGFEFQLDYSHLQDSDGDASGSFIYGTNFGEGTWVTSAAVRHRSRLRQRDRSWSVRLGGDYLPYGGWSSIGNPGTLYAFADTSPEGDGLTYDTLLGDPQPDPGCAQVGAVIFRGVCNFNYTFFDNVVEEQTQWQLFSEYNGLLANGITMHLEMLAADTDVPEQATSPSFPPQQLVDPSQAVFPSSPAWQSLAAAFPTYFSQLPQQPDYIIVRGRVDGVGARGPRLQERNYRTYRVAGSIQGTFFNDVDFDLGASWSRSRGGYEERDARVDRTTLAYRGFGGEACGATLNADLTINANGAQAGIGACHYFNPFSTAVASGYLGRFDNPNFDSANTNDQSLLDWIDDQWYTEGVNDLWTVDALARGRWHALDWAIGGQFRHNHVRQRVDDAANIRVNPCRLEGDLSCQNPEGLHSYLAPITPYDVDQSTVALFLEVQTTVGDSLDLGLGLRAESYSDGLFTLDPKLALQYTLNTEWSARSSLQTTFRAPDPNQLSDGVFTEQGYVSQTLAFKAIDTQGNPDLDPESALTWNIGVVYSGSTLQGSIDYWYFDFDNPIVSESYNELVAAYEAGGDRKAAVVNQIVCPSGAADGSCSAALIERILPSVVNGPAIKTDGLDLSLKYQPVGVSDIELALELSYTRRYSVASYSKNGMLISAGYEAAGYYNFNNSTRPLPDLKARFLVTYRPNINTTFTLSGNYVSAYKDRRDPVKELAGTDRIDSWLTFDAHLAFQANDATRVVLSAINATDEEPPLVYGDLMYDSYSHNGLGRLVKLGVSVAY